MRQTDRTGYVYVVQFDDYFKIGMTKRPDGRIPEINLVLPKACEPVLIIKTNDRFKLERELHDKYAHKRLRGEWFDLQVEDVCGIGDSTPGATYLGDWSALN